MNILKHKFMRILLRLTLVVVAAFFCLVVMKKDIDNIYYKLKYREEVAFLQKSLHIIVTADEATIRGVFTPDSPWQRDNYVLQMKKVLQKINVSNFRILIAQQAFRANRKRLFIGIYFQNDESLYFDLQLRRDSRWLILSAQPSDKIVRMMGINEYQ
jgi:hypothetical protein